MSRYDEIRERATCGLEKYIDERKPDQTRSLFRYIHDSDKDTLWLLDEVERLTAERDEVLKDMKITHSIGTNCVVCKRHGICDRERVEVGHCALLEWRGLIEMDIV